MVFKKIGDPMPIKGIIKADGDIAICEECGLPMVAIEIDEDDNMQLACTCKNPDLE